MRNDLRDAVVTEVRGRVLSACIEQSSEPQGASLEHLVRDTLYHEIRKHMDDGIKGAPLSLKRIGDCEAPAIIAAAVFAGHRYARELDTTPDIDNPLRHERIVP